MKPVMLCGLLAESLTKIDALRHTAGKPVPPENTAVKDGAAPVNVSVCSADGIVSSGDSGEDAALETADRGKDPREEAVLAALEELHRYEELIDEIGGEACARERSEMFFLCAAAVRVLTAEVYDLTADVEDRSRAKGFNSEAMRAAKKTAGSADARGAQAAEEVLFNAKVINL